MWHCKCECGNEKDILEKLLKNGDSASCSCGADEIIKEI